MAEDYYTALALVDGDLMKARRNLVGIMMRNLPEDAPNEASASRLVDEEFRTILKTGVSGDEAMQILYKHVRFELWSMPFSGAQSTYNDVNSSKPIWTSTSNPTNESQVKVWLNNLIELIGDLPMNVKSSRIATYYAKEVLRRYIITRARGTSTEPARQYEAIRQRLFEWWSDPQAYTLGADKGSWTLLNDQTPFERYPKQFKPSDASTVTTSGDGSEESQSQPEEPARDEPTTVPTTTVPRKSAAEEAEERSLLEEQRAQAEKERKEREQRDNDAAAKKLADERAEEDRRRKQKEEDDERREAAEAERVANQRRLEETQKLSVEKQLVELRKQLQDANATAQKYLDERNDALTRVGDVQRQLDAYKRLQVHILNSDLKPEVNLGSSLEMEVEVFHVRPLILNPKQVEAAVETFRIRNGVAGGGVLAPVLKAPMQGARLSFGADANLHHALGQLARNQFGTQRARLQFSDNSGRVVTELTASRLESRPFAGETRLVIEPAANKDVTYARRPAHTETGIPLRGTLQVQVFDGERESSSQTFNYALPGDDVSAYRQVTTSQDHAQLYATGLGGGLAQLDLLVVDV